MLPLEDPTDQGGADKPWGSPGAIHTKEAGGKGPGTVSTGSGTRVVSIVGPPTADYQVHNQELRLPRRVVEAIYPGDV